MTGLFTFIRSKLIWFIIILIALNSFVILKIFRKLENDKIYINLMNRQTMVIQKLSKDFFISLANKKEFNYQDSVSLFESTHSALISGGDVQSDVGSDSKFRVDKIEHSEVVKALELVHTNWKNFLETSKDLKSKGEISLSKYLAGSDKLAVLMSNTTLLFQSVSGNSVLNLIVLQLVVTFVILLLFVNAEYYIRRLKSANNSLMMKYVEVDKESEEITGQIKIGQNQMFELVEEKKNLQALLMRVGNIALLGNVASGIPYELNNPITVLAGYADELNEMIDGKGINENLLHSFVHKIKKSANQIRNIIDHASMYCRNQEKLERELKNPKEIIDDALYLMDRQLKNENVDVNIDIKPNLPQFWVNAVKIGSILQNIIRFSCVSFENNEQEIDKKINILVHVPGDGKFIAIELSDNGGAIPEEELSRVFDPLYGSGSVSSYIGLSVTREIIHHHKGSIEIRNDDENYKTFTIKLPVDVRDERRQRS